MSHISFTVDIKNKCLASSSSEPRLNILSNFRSSSLYQVNNMAEEIIDINNETLSTRLSSLRNPNVKVPKQAMKQANNDKGSSYFSLFSNFPKPTSTFNATLPLKHSVRHHICTYGLPIYSEPRRFLPKILNQVQI